MRLRRGEPRDRDRQLDHEFRALPPAGTVGDDAAPVQLDEVFDEGQTESEARMRSRARAVRLPKALEDVRQDLRGDALSRIAHHDLDVRVDELQLHLDSAALRGELHRVREQGPYDLLEPGRIADGRPRPRVEHFLEPDLFRLGGRPDGIERAVDHGVELDRPDV